MYDGLLKFIKDAAARFSAIARSVGSRPEELHADAVFVVDDIARKRGRPVDFDNAADQGLVINGVYWSAKGQKDWRLSRAYSINDDREGVTRWADRLAAPESSCPMNILLYREDALAATGPYAHTYTQVAAYHFAIINLAYEDLCNRLMVSPRTILNRVSLRANWQIDSTPCLTRLR